MTNRCFGLLPPAMLAISVLIWGGAGLAAEQPLPPDEAFKFKASFKRPDVVVAEIIPAKNHYFYKSKTQSFTLYSTYQGCNEKLGICYPPIEKTIEMKFPK